MKKRFIMTIGAIFVVLLLTLTACGTARRGGPGSLVEDNWGRSFEAVKRAQILNPDAGNELKTSDDMDGDAAIKGYDAYKDSFKAAPTKK